MGNYIPPIFSAGRTIHDRTEKTLFVNWFHQTKIIIFLIKNIYLNDVHHLQFNMYITSINTTLALYVHYIINNTLTYNNLHNNMLLTLFDLNYIAFHTFLSIPFISHKVIDWLIALLTLLFYSLKHFFANVTF